MCIRDRSEGGQKGNSSSKAEMQEELEVHFIDVGQGDSTLIQTGDHAMPVSYTHLDVYKRQ